MKNFNFREAEQKRKFEFFYLAGTILITIGVVRLIESIKFDDNFITFLLILIGIVLFLIGNNKHFAKLYAGED